MRIFFEKRGEAAYISLLDLQRVFHRLLKRSGLPVWYTQGFNPHIYLAFSNPLPLGQESLCESCEVKTEDAAPDGAFWRDTLRPYLPQGITVTGVAPAVHKIGDIASADYALTLPRQARDALHAYNAADSVPVQKRTKRGQRTLELKTWLPRLEPGEDGAGQLRLALRLPCTAGEGENLNPALLLDALHALAPAAPLEPWRCHILRTGLYLADGAPFC